MADSNRAEQGTIMTRKGLNILAKGIAGKLIKFTRVAIGDSTRNNQLVEVTDAQILNLTDLINPLQDIPIVGFQNPGGGVVVIQAYLHNADFQQGLFVREMGLFAEDPDTGQEVLYSYRNVGELGGYTPSGQGAVIVNRQINLITVVDNAENITAAIDASQVYINQAQFLDHVNATNPHPNLTILTANDVLALTAEATAQLSSRVNQVETNVSNLFMQISETDANLIVFEDFKDLHGIDTLQVKVLTAPKNSPTITVESLDGIVAGHYYTLSDGVRSRYFRAQSLASNAGTYSITFEGNVNYNFTISKTYLYRSTAIIDDGLASGSAKEKESTFAPDDVFTGSASSSTKTLTLTTTQKKASNFTVTGSGAFTSDGFFTLS